MNLLSIPIAAVVVLLPYLAKAAAVQMVDALFPGTLKFARACTWKWFPAGVHIHQVFAALSKKKWPVDPPVHGDCCHPPYTSKVCPRAAGAVAQARMSEKSAAIRFRLGDMRIPFRGLREADEFPPRARLLLVRLSGNGQLFAAMQVQPMDDVSVPEEEVMVMAVTLGTIL